MKNFELIKSKYLSWGVTEDNIDFAIDSVAKGTKREIIIETLTADYRGMTESKATQLLNELYLENGGEFKKENRSGYFYGAFLTLVGLISTTFLILMLVTGESEPKLILLAASGVLIGLLQGPVLIYKSMKGKYRDDDAPFSE